MNNNDFAELQKINFFLKLYELADSIKVSDTDSVRKLHEAKQRIYTYANKELESNALKSPIDPLYIRRDTLSIRNHLDIQACNSIDYSFIPETTPGLKRVKAQLLKDNLRMENARLDYTIKNEIERFYSFCVHAFYQLEDLLNLFFHFKFKPINELLKHLDFLNIKVDNRSKVKSIANISTFTKIDAFIKMNYNGHNDNIRELLTFIRRTRNEEMHRCSILIKDRNIDQQFKALIKRKQEFNAKSQNGILYPNTDADWHIENEYKYTSFLREKPYDLVRNAIQRVVNTTQRLTKF